MIRFLDGPAAGVNLVLQRAPILLRVVRDPAGKWDALDQLSDQPAADETLFVYRRIGEPASAFLDYADKQGRRRGCYTCIADYQHVDEPIDDSAIRDATSWRAWCMTNVDRLLAPTGGAA